MGKKILVIQYAFPPVKGAEPPVSAKAIRFLAEEGHEVTVVLSDPATSVDGGDSSLKGYLDHPNIKLCLVTGFEPKLGIAVMERTLSDLLKLPDPKFFWRRNALKKSIQLLKQNHFDLVYTRSQYFSSQLIGLELKKQFGLPWLTHFSDPWANNPYVKYATDFAKKKNSAWEREVISQADSVTMPSQILVNNYKKLYPEQAEKFDLLSHSYDQSLYKKSKRVGKKMSIGYIGAFYGARSPKPLLQSINLMTEDQKSDFFSKFEFVFIGPMLNSIRQEIEEKYSQYIRLKPPVNYLESLQIMGEMDVLLVIDAPAKESPFLPSKLIDYLGANKFLVGITPEKGASADLIIKTGGLVADPEKTKEIVSALEKLTDIAKKGKLSLPDSKIRDQYSLDNSNKILDKIISKIC